LPVLEYEAATVVQKSYEILKGDVDAAMAKADVVVTGTYRVGHQEQMYIEPQGMVAVPRPDGGMTVFGSLQCPYYVHKALTRILGLPSEQVVVVQTVTGGAFGGKEEYPSMIAAHAALAARKAGRPVRIVYDRAEDVAATTKRHPATVVHRTGVTKDGRLVAMDVDVLMDGGAYVTLRDAARRGRVPLRPRARAVASGDDEHAAERRVPRVRGAPDHLRDRAADGSCRRGRGP
jgi:xanthine dehydrogenase molybdopterin-binding subunit B